jgi:ATP-dependent helicase/nuclease subunit B
MGTAGRVADRLQQPSRGYKSRALPFREGDVDGDYIDHLARVLEWSAGGDDGGGAE